MGRTEAQKESLAPSESLRPPHSTADGPSEQTQVCSRPDPVTANVKEMTTRVYVCGGGNSLDLLLLEITGKWTEA